MAITDLIPWKKRQAHRRGGELALQVREDPFPTLQQQMNRMFDDFFKGSGFEPFDAFQEGWDAFTPHVDVTENDREIRVSVELPGLEEKDIDVRVSRDVLTISGKKNQEAEEKGRNYLRSERRYGSFGRSIRLPSGVDSGKVDARFRNGVLTVTLPRKSRAGDRRKIRIRAQ